MAAARGRPLGEVSVALISAAAAMGPAPVRELARRACVGYDVARFKASALVRSGVLVPLTDARPRVLACASASSRADGLTAAVLSFWESGRGGTDDAGKAESA